MSETLAPLITETVSILQAVCARFAAVAFANSLSAEDMVLTDLIHRQQLPIEIFTLDTGRLHEETYQTLVAAVNHYQRPIQVYTPDNDELETFVNTHGINSFYDSVENRKACCAIRKLAPLKRALRGKQAWMTGLRRAQSPTRAQVGVEEWDANFQLTKFNPLLAWQEEDVWAYVRAHQVPYNALHDRHFPSIGCAPCTRAIAVGEDIRAGRWWWENPDSKECGLHVSRVPLAGA